MLVRSLVQMVLVLPLVKTGSYTAVPQIGNVVIEDHVDIGANTTIDRATLGSTIIRKGVKVGQSHSNCAQR